MKCPKCKEAYLGNGKDLCLDCEREEKEEKAMKFKKLEKLLGEFTHEMKQRLADHDQAGWTGWDDAHEMANYKGGLKERIIRNALNNDFIDVANLAMFAWFHKSNE